jgi:hypothetical protein
MRSYNYTKLLLVVPLLLWLAGCGDGTPAPTPTPFVSGKNIILANSVSQPRLIHTANAKTTGRLTITVTNTSQTIQTFAITVDAPTGLEVAEPNASTFKRAVSVAGKSLDLKSSIVLEFSYRLNLAELREYGLYQLQISADSIDGENITTDQGVEVFPPGYPVTFPSDNVRKETGNGVTLETAYELGRIGHFAGATRVFSPSEVWVTAGNASKSPITIDLEVELAPGLQLTTVAMNKVDATKATVNSLTLRPKETRIYSLSIRENVPRIGTYQVNLSAKTANQINTLAKLTHTISVFPRSVPDVVITNWRMAFAQNNAVKTSATHAAMHYEVTSALDTPALSRTVTNGALWIKLVNPTQTTNTVCSLSVKTLATIQFSVSGSNQAEVNDVALGSQEERYVPFFFKLDRQFDKGKSPLVVDVTCSDGVATEVRQEIVIN